jgi:nucleoside-diphosphate-sugar epimerase
MSVSPTVLVVGAQGRFGRAAVDAFAAAGWSVLALARRAPDGAAQRRVRWLDTRLTDPATLAQSRAARVVVHAANPSYTRWPTEALPLARASMDLAQRLGATFMLPGNVYGFGAGMPARLDEATPEQPTTRKGAIRVALEAELRERAGSGLDSVVLRAGDFFGGAASGNWFDQAIVKHIARGRLVYPGPLDVAHAWAYLPDLARAFVALANAPRAAAPAARRLHFEGHTLTGAELLAALERVAARLGLAPERGWGRSRLPWPLLRLGGLVVPMWRELADMAYLWHVPHRLDGSALRARVSALPATPLETALTESLLALGFGRAQPSTALS